MNKTSWTTSGLALGCLLALGSADLSAQTPIRSGQTIRGSLDASDAKADDNSFFDLYTFQGRAGERVSIRLASSSFDAYLSLGRMNGKTFEEIESDDDSGGGSDALITVTLPSEGTYIIRANSLSEGETGAYTLSLTPAGAVQGGSSKGASAPSAGVIRFGQTVSGSLDTSDAILDADDTYYDLWRFTGRRGQRVEITLASSAFDAYLVLGRMNGSVMEPQASNDDGGGGTDARIRTTLPADGEYVIRANTLSQGETGAYTLRLAELAARPAPPAPSAIRAGQTVNGTLSSSDPQAGDDSYYDAYAYQGRAGERLTIIMKSAAFDTYLVIGRMVNGEFEQIDSDDDGAGGTDSKLEITLDEPGTYVIRANSLTSEATGAYTLSIQSKS
jgi:hypothetical protein